MASLKELITQAISDFDGVKAALEENGIAVPYDTDTSEYGNLVRQAIAASDEEIVKLVASLNSDVSALTGEVEDLSKAVEKKANAEDVYSAEEVDSLLKKINAEVVKQFSIGGVLLEKMGNQIDFPIAAYKTLGAVQSSDKENEVAVTAEGVMQVNSLNVNKLVQTEGEELVLNGGSSKL